MIDFLAIILERMLQHIRPDEVLSGNISYNRIPLAHLQRICYAAETDTIETSLEKKMEYMRNWVEQELIESGKPIDTHQSMKSVPTVGFFDLLNCFSGKVLTVKSGEVIFSYDKMKPWHRLSGKIGTDLLVVSEYAFNDYKFAVKRKSFLWKTVLNHDNYALNMILKEGISDNHYHLRGSVPYFDLSWLSLMNSLMQSQVAKRMDQMYCQSRNIENRFYSDKAGESYNILHMKAALIRVYLYACLTGKRIWLEEYKASPKWILEQIFRLEPVKQYVPQTTVFDTDEDVNRMSLRIWMEKNIAASYSEDQEGEEKIFLQEIKKFCPGFYWFFWELFPEIPVRILSNLDSLFCRNNIEIIIQYINALYEKPSLENCAWLFQGADIQIYNEEWDQQTKKVVYELLKEPYRLSASRSHIQSVIDVLQNYSALKYKDYMLNEVKPWNTDEWEQAVISGERWFLYQMIYNHCYGTELKLSKRDDIYDLFFIYLLIKEAFRLELLYNNDKIGFDNFQAYQRRKNWFTTSFSEGELAAIAVKEAFQDQCLKSLELRVMPENSDTENIRTIRRYDKAILENWTNGNQSDYYYVFHFRKQKEENIKKECSLKCRHAKFRNQLKKQTNAILKMREKNSKVGRRLLGIDACSSEDGCRPEVFAKFFRILKHHQAEDNLTREKLPQLRISYHVGEENQDVLDGLRAIDEAIFFLNLESGDRIGHATMLGIDAMEWYYKNHYQVSIRQLDYLDNVVWLYEKIVQYHIPNQNNLLEYLEREFYVYFERIYHGKQFSNEYKGIESHEFDIHHYFISWELRGDDPKLYQSGSYKRIVYPQNIWDDHAVNSKVENEKRNMLKATALYHAYHFNNRVYEEGNKSIVVNIPIHMVKGIFAVQRKMRKKIAQRGIAIETNPTSNVLISGLKNYGNHPIVTFYNKGLTNDIERIRDCPQLNVSINTDDLGVFMTCLNNEYALMANALEMKRDQEGNRMYKKDMIYDWIDHIRIMGNNQAFSKDGIRSDIGERRGK